MMFKPDWKNIKDEKPEIGKPVFLTDGKTFATATPYQVLPDGKIWFNGYGFSGYEWEFDWFNLPTHWAYIEMELPKL